jgi:hypothetical protein
MAGERPTSDAVRAAMAVPSSAGRRGQRDAVGFASTAAQMALVCELAAGPPPPEALGPPPAAPCIGAIAPHDDYLYSARVLHRVLQLVTAPTVLLVGVFHRYRRFGVRDRLVPATRAGQPVKVVFTMTFRFRLDDGAKKP